LSNIFKNSKVNRSLCGYYCDMIVGVGLEIAISRLDPRDQWRLPYKQSNVRKVW